ncbi:MAG: DNA-directed DNA polymerase [Candidatus Aenigmarchaeota archaeon]|nr:DNA-directed DNA polymerase [Candidatus Aenigmarchaeota archaeon]
MDLDFQLLDCDYMNVNNRPVIRMFGKMPDGKTACAFVEGVEPYFYVLPTDFKEETVKAVEKFLHETFHGAVKKIEVVQRFLPIGYHADKNDLLKIVATDPSRVPEIREALRGTPFVKEMFEADILFKYRFMADRKISGLGMLKVTGVPAGTNTIKAKQKLTAEKIEASSEAPFPDFRYAAIDIEVVGSNEGLPDARRDEIAMISIAFHPHHDGDVSLVLITKPIKSADKSVRVFSNEKDMLKEFVKIFDAYDPDVVVGYNINGFDLPYITERFKQLGIPCTIGRCNVKPATCKKLGMHYRNTIPGRIIADTYDLIKDAASRGGFRLKRYGLGDVSRALLNEDKVDIAHSEISKYWNGDGEQIEKLIAYSRKDSELALRLLLEKNMLDKFIALSRVSGLLLQDSLSGGESARIENLLLRKFNEAGFVVPCKPSPEEFTRRNIERETKGLKGALVLEPESGLHTSCIAYLDFKSMYPSIYISFNICPTTLVDSGPESDFKLDADNLAKLEKPCIDTPYGSKFVSKDTRRGIIPGIVEYLITERDKVKKVMKSEKDKNRIRELDAKQLALKVMSNAFYGYTGYMQAKVYLLSVANTITSCGRYLIQKTRDTVEEDKRFKVIYGDTDSIMVKTGTDDVPKAFDLGNELAKTINARLEGIVSIKTEGVFKTILILTKKRYGGWMFERADDEHGEIITKGIETVRRDWCDLVGETLYTVLEIVLKEQNPKKAFEHVRGVMRRLQNNEIPIEKLVITKSISKPIKSYKGVQPHIEVVKKMRMRSPNDAPGVGDRVGFVIVHGMQLLSNRAEDPDYVKAHGIKVDSKYYMENQLVPPLERVFESMGIEKSELLGIGKQMLLSSLLGKKASAATVAAQLEVPLASADGLVCEKCAKVYIIPPLSGKCVACGGGLLFYIGDVRSKYCTASISA